MGDVEPSVVSTGAFAPTETTLPTVSNARETRPDTGAEMAVYHRLICAASSAAFAAFTAAAASRFAFCASS